MRLTIRQLWHLIYIVLKHKRSFHAYNCIFTVLEFVILGEGTVTFSSTVFH